jgi:hypothetical protein
MALLTEDGLNATYLASSLRQPPVAGPSAVAPAPSTRSVESRLTELGSLRDRGVITETEYAEQRRAILDQV